MPPQSGNASESAAVRPGVSRGRVPGAAARAGFRGNSCCPPHSAEGKLSPRGAVARPSHPAAPEALVSAASSLPPGPGAGPLSSWAPPHSHAEARTWPTLTPSGRAVAGGREACPGQKPPRRLPLPRQRTALSAAASAGTGMMQPGPAREALGDRV